MAKSDKFSYDEFKEMGEVIRRNCRTGRGQELMISEA